ncbi:hypothetical protein [Nonomuraea aridisoli]|uniref:hypothetical protein n=1 Tax=Nonomuraea aridisoli TaxID=2070368 RepID=UPI0015E8BC57|nr:hypothetical protein [Nonomuraea aridisoli]
MKSFVRISLIAVIGRSLTPATASADTPARERSALAGLLGDADLGGVLFGP